MSGRAFGRETKFQKVRTELETLANRLGPEQKLPSIRELSVTMGASVSTLTGALEELENQNLVYRRHGVGIFVSPSRVKSIWLICDSQFFSRGHSPFWDVLVEHARVRALKNNEHLSMHFTLPEGQPDETLHHALVEEIQAGRVHGIIGIGLGRSTAEWILSQKVPYTAFASWAPYVVAMHYTGMVQEGVEALIAQGCQRIGLWKPTEPYNAERDPMPTYCPQTQTFIETLEAHQMPIDESLIRNNWHLLSEPTREPFQQQGYRTAKEVFEQDQLQPDGIIITDDIMTHGALLAMARMGIKPGHDIQIASHTNKGTSVLLEEEDIIRIEFDPEAVIQRLFALLETLMAGVTPQDTEEYFSDAQAQLIRPKIVLPQLHL